MNGADDIGDSVTVQVESNANGESSATTTHPPRNADVPKPKRLACMICRKRKLRCDGNRPRCSTCTRLGHDCAYDEVRRKSGPKRGYVKALEERLSACAHLSRARPHPHGRSGCDPQVLRADSRLTLPTCRTSRDAPQNTGASCRLQDRRERFAIHHRQPASRNQRECGGATTTSAAHGRHQCH